MYWAFLGCRSAAKRFYLILLQRLAEGEQKFIRARPDALANLGRRIPNGRICVDLTYSGSDRGLDKTHLRRLLEIPVEDPEIHTIYVARNPPLSKFHYPIRFGVPEDVSDGLDLCFKFDSMARYDQDLAVKYFRTDTHVRRWNKGLTIARFSHDPTAQPLTPSQPSFLLAIFKLRLTVPHFGTPTGRLSNPSTSLQALLIGLEDPPGNSDLTPSAYYVPWYSFISWPEIDELGLDKFPTPSVLADLVGSRKHSAQVSRCSHIYLSDPSKRPVRCLRLVFRRTLRRSAWNYDAVFEFETLRSATTASTTPQLSFHLPISPISSSVKLPSPSLASFGEQTVTADTPANTSLIRDIEHGIGSTSAEHTLLESRLYDDDWDGASNAGDVSDF